MKSLERIKGKPVKLTSTAEICSVLGVVSGTTNGTAGSIFAEWYKYDSPYTLNYFRKIPKDLFDPNKKPLIQTTTDYYELP